MSQPKARRVVLLVDDEEMFRDFLTECLEGAGYDVVAAASGEEALRLYAAQAASFDLVLTDMVMPGLTGLALVARLRQSQPQFKVLFMSGYGENSATEAQGALLSKPFTSPELLAAVRKTLGDAPAGTRGEARPPIKKRRSPR